VIGGREISAPPPSRATTTIDLLSVAPSILSATPSSRHGIHVPATRRFRGRTAPIYPPPLPVISLRPMVFFGAAKWSARGSHPSVSRPHCPNLSLTLRRVRYKIRVAATRRTRLPARPRRSHGWPFLQCARWNIWQRNPIQPKIELYFAFLILVFVCSLNLYDLRWLATKRKTDMEVANTL
jgi:hypothetical protein